MIYGILFAPIYCYQELIYKDVTEMIGHSDISMTDRYSHLTLNHHKAMQEKLVKHYENTMN
jgi:hypothetical protein